MIHAVFEIKQIVKVTLIQQNYIFSMKKLKCGIWLPWQYIKLPVTNSSVGCDSKPAQAQFTALTCLGKIIPVKNVSKIDERILEGSMLLFLH